MKISSVTPVYKPNKPKDCIESYRPISVSNNFMKIFEALLFNNLNSFITTNNIIPDSQYGFRAGISTFHQLIELIYELTIAFNDSNLLCVDFIFLDYSNAFVTISHSELLYELKCIGITDKMLKLITSFLKERKECVKYEDVYSELFNVISGVIQGGKMSPTLFNIYVRKLLSVILASKSAQYADDNVLYKPIFSHVDTQLMQTDLNAIHDWSKEYNLNLNASKSVHLRFTLKKSIELPLYTIDNQVIPLQQKHKHLGVFIDNKLTFNYQTEYVYNSCIRKWTTIKRLCPFASPSILTQLYKVYILPLIEYCFHAWIPNEQQCKRVESIQRHITKYICIKLKLYNLSYSERLTKLDLKPLIVRKNLKMLKYAFKSIYNYIDVPFCWKNKFIIKETRNGLLLENIHSRLQFCDKNFFIYTINLFNSLPVNIRNEKQFVKFISLSESFLIEKYFVTQF